MDINKYGVKGKLSFASLGDIEDALEADIYEILWLAKNLKRRQTMKENLKEFDGKTVVIMLGSQNSTVRISFELAVQRLGGKTLYLSPKDADFAGGLTYLDAMTAIGRYGASGMVFKDEKGESGDMPLPFINLCGSPDACNVLANIFTVWEKTGRLSGLKLLIFGDGKSISAGEINAYAKCGASVTLACPEKNAPSAEAVGRASQFGDLAVVSDISKAAGADVITSSGGKRSRYTVTEEIMAAFPSAYYIHPLPVKHGADAEDGVLYGERSLVFDQAENLVYIEQAVMILLFGGR